MEEEMNNMDGNQMYSNEQTISLNRDVFSIDFKQIVFQYASGHKAVKVINHKGIIMQPYLFKHLIGVMQDTVKDYEKKFGEIKVDKKASKSNVPVDIIQSESTAYIG
tara:strand:+ start:231 stop:551 length:321 start_codon:yes stop_codon:yes gene_type:complete